MKNNYNVSNKIIPKLLNVINYPFPYPYTPPPTHTPQKNKIKYCPWREYWTRLVEVAHQLTQSRPDSLSRWLKLAAATLGSRQQKPLHTEPHWPSYPNFPFSNDNHRKDKTLLFPGYIKRTCTYTERAGKGEKSLSHQWSSTINIRSSREHRG